MYKDIFNKKISSEHVLNAIHELDSMGIAESFDQLQSRTQNALLDIAQKEAAKGIDSNILVIAHGMSILGLLLNWGGRELLETHLENAAVCKVSYHNGKIKVLSMGDMSYVTKGREVEH